MRVVLRLIVLMSLSSAVNAAAIEPLSLAEAERIALAGSPVLAEIKARYEAALEVPEQLGALPDPVLTVGMINVPTDTFDLDQEAMTQFRVGFSQALPWASERRLAKSSAQQQAKATAAELNESRNRLR
ncbi:MAG: TolC family protein, partial [Halopseudomonas sp.]